MIPNIIPPRPGTPQGWSPNSLRPTPAQTVAAVASVVNQAYAGSALAAGEPGLLYVARFGLTAAQLNTLNSSPLPIILAPGAGRIIIPMRWIMQQQMGAAVFTVVRVVAPVYTTTTTPNLLDPFTLLNTINDTVQRMEVPASPVAGTINASYDNLGISLRTTNDSAAGSGTCRFTILWEVIETGFA